MYALCLDLWSNVIETFNSLEEIESHIDSKDYFVIYKDSLSGDGAYWIVTKTPLSL